MRALLLVLSLLMASTGYAVTFAPSTPARALNSNFQPSTTRWMLCTYTVEIVATASVAGGNSGTVELRSNESTPPTTVRTSATNGFTITLGAGIGWTSTQRWALSYIVPPGHYVRLDTAGAATITLVNQTEQTIAPDLDATEFTTGIPYK